MIDPAQSNRRVCDAAATGDAERLEALLSAGLSACGHFDPAAVEARAQELNASIGGAALDPELESILTPELREMMDKTTRELNERLAAAPWSHEIPLFCAAQSGSADCVRLLLNAGADPKARDNSKRTAMYHANSSAVVQTLMDAGVPLEDADEYGWTPLVAALSEGETALPRLRALLDAGVDVNGTHDRGYTVFMSAVGSGRYPEALRLLVAAGADPHAVSELGYNAFHAAIDVNGEANDEASVRDTLGYLKELGVDLEQPNHIGCTPLARAIQEGTGVEVQVLCEFGADPNAVCPVRVCGGGECESAEQPLLFQAVEGCGVDRDVKTEALLKAGANPLVEDAEGFTPLVQAVAALCSDAEDYEASFNAFYEGLGELEQVSKTPGRSRDEFVAVVSKIVRPYVERFAATIPISNESQFAGEWRKARITCIVSLYAYEQWSQLT